MTDNNYKTIVLASSLGFAYRRDMLVEEPKVVVQKFTVGGITDIFVSYFGFHLTVKYVLL